MINTSESRIIFNGNGTATEFPYSFAIINDTDVKVMTVDPDGVETVLDSDYYVDVTASKVIYPGYPPGEEPAESERPPVLPTGWQLVVYRDIPITQEANLGNVWPFNVIEDALDKITMILQTSRDTSDRSLKVSESTPSDVDVVVPVALNMTLKWDAQGKKIVLTKDPAEVLTQAQNLLQQTTEQANIATEQAGIATSKANATAESAVSAATSATNAANSASTATTKANAAADSATDAANSASAAASSQSAAAASATDAAGSASDAADSAAEAALSAASLTTDSALSTTSTNPVQNKVVTAALNEKQPIINKAGYHNSIFRGKCLGTSLTAAQSAAIQAGTFDDLFIGDYWTIGGVDYVIVAFDYYYNTGDTACTTHHAVIVPRAPLYSAQMNTSDVTTGAYVGSKMYTENLNQAKTTIQNAFGASHLLSIRQHFQNATTNGYESGGTWYDATVWLMSEANVYGGNVFKSVINGTGRPNLYSIDHRQYPYFRYALPNEKRLWYWLRDVASSSYFVLVYGGGDSGTVNASTSSGVRPAFCIKG